MLPFGSLFRGQEDYWKLRDCVVLVRNLVDGPMGVNTEMCHLTSRRISQRRPESHPGELRQPLVSVIPGPEKWIHYDQGWEYYIPQ